MEPQNRMGGKWRIVAIVVALVVILGGGGIYLYSRSHQSSTTNNSQVAATATPAPTVSYQGEDGRTALDLLNAKHTVETQTTTYGPMVTSIDGVKATAPYFWSFYVNGQLATEGAATYRTQTTDEIEWKLEKY